MSNRIKLKRNSASDFDQSTPLPSGLHYGEIGFQNHLKRLYIGKLASNTTDDGATTIHLPLLSDLTDGTGLTKTVASGNTDNSVTLDLDVAGISSTLSSGLNDSQDHFAVSDNGTMKKVTFATLRDEIIDVISGDVAVAAGGTATIQANAVHGSMLNADTAGTGLTYAGGNLDVAAAQTGITSLLATDIKIGEDNQTKIDFETADEIHFYAANTEQVYLGDNIFGPQSDSDVDLGSNSVRWKDAYVDSLTVTNAVSSGSFSTTNLIGTNVISNTYKYNNSGSAGATAFTIGATGGVTFNQALSLTTNTQIKTGTGAILRLYTGETDVVANEVLGRIDFAAPDEATVGDARLLAASISAVAAGTFSSTSNATKLVFSVGNSETASTAMTIDNNKKVIIEGDLQVKGTTTTVDSTVVVIEDPIFTLGGADNAASDDEKDRGIEFKWHTGSAPKTGFFGMDEDDNTFTFIPQATVSSETYSGTLGNAKFGSVAATAITGATINGGTYD